LPRSTSGGVFGRGSETANVVAEQNRDAVVNRARNRQVESAIVIEVGGGDKTSLNFNRIIGARSKCPVAVAGQDGDAAKIADSQIEFAIAVKVSGREREGQRSDSVTRPGAKPAHSVIEQNRNRPSHRLRPRTA